MVYRLFDANRIRASTAVEEIGMLMCGNHVVTGEDGDGIFTVIRG
jgi:hypothetical protein